MTVGTGRMMFKHRCIWSSFFASVFQEITFCCKTSWGLGTFEKYFPAVFIYMSSSSKAGSTVYTQAEQVGPVSL